MNSSLVGTKWGRTLAKRLMKPIQKKKNIEIIKKWNIVSGDLVKVIQGPQTGEQGKVIQVLRASNRVLIENVNMVFKFNFSTIIIDWYNFYLFILFIYKRDEELLNLKLMEHLENL
jgi:hypothetical protein